MEDADHALTVQALIPHRPGHDLPHALHLVEARKVHQHRERRKQLQAFGKCAEHRDRSQDVRIRLDAELLHEIVLVAHLLVLIERREFRIRHPDRFQQERIGCDMDRLHVGERGQHHLDLGRAEDARIPLHVVVVHFHVRLREEAEDLRQQVAFLLVELGRPVLAVLPQRHLFRHPVDLLLALPEVIGPWIAERLVGVGRRQDARARQNTLCSG